LSVTSEHSERAASWLRGTSGRNACCAGRCCFCFVDCCSLGEECIAERCRADTARQRRRRTDVSFALRTSVHNLNRMPPCLSAHSQRPLCNCCHRPGAPSHPWRCGWRSRLPPRPAVVVGLGARGAVLLGPDPPPRPRKRKYQSGCGCWTGRKRVGPGYLRQRADPGCGLAGAPARRPRLTGASRRSKSWDCSVSIRAG
jgi:hypothetical protein